MFTTTPPSTTITEQVPIHPPPQFTRHLAPLRYGAPEGAPSPIKEEPRAEPARGARAPRPGRGGLRDWDAVPDPLSGETPLAGLEL